MENNIFDSVVAEPTATPEANVVLIPLGPIVAGPIIPFSDIDDVKDSGLNQ